MGFASFTKISVFSDKRGNMKNTRSTILLAAAVLALSACGATPAEKYERAQEAFAANEFKSARLDLISALQEDPQNSGMNVLLARTLIALSDGEGANSALERLSDADSASDEVRLLRGEADVLRGRFDAAIETVEGIYTASADRVRGLAYIGLEDTEKAAEAFAAGEAREGVHAPLYASYARFELARGNVGKAREYADAAIKADPKLVDARLAAGRVASAESRFQDALTHYDVALELNDGNFDGRLGRSGILAELGQLDEARDIAAGLSSEAPNDTRITFLLGKIDAAAGNWEEVRARLQGVEGELKTAPDMQVVYGEALLRLGQVAQSRSLLEPLLSRFSGSRKLRVLIAEAQLQSSDANSALATIKPLVVRPDATPAELSLAAMAAKASGDAAASDYSKRAKRPAPEWLGGELAKADQALRNRQWTKAETSYEAILARTPAPNAMVLNNLAFVKSQLGKDDRALGLALEALAIEPEHASVLDTAGWLLVQDGQKDRGVELLRKAARIDPNNKAIARHLDQATRD